MLNHVGKLSFLSLAVSLSLEVSAAGFAIQEQSITGLGRAFAGSAAVADDASTIFFNPAGLTYLSQSQINAGIHFLVPKADFDNNGSSLPPALGSAPISGSDSDGGQNAIVPNFYYAHRLNDKTVLGIGVNAPFGLVTEYDDDWVGRYHAIKSDLKTINVNPSIAFKTSDKLSVGFGINVQYVELELTQAVDFGAACAQAFLGGLPAAAACASPQNFDGKAKLEADDLSWGYNLGLIYQATPDIRFGLHYRSKISHTLDGDGEFRIPNNSAVQTIAGLGGFDNGSVYGRTTFPETLSLAIHHQFNNKWALSADTTFTRWSRFEKLAIRSDSVDKLNSTKAENWENSLRYAIGVDYKYNSKWQFRAGVAYEETPVPSANFRTARIPDNDRKWFSLGSSYRLNEEFIIDTAYSFIHASNPKINETDDNGYTLSGEYEGNVHIFAMQIRWLL
jgi:long-chain fatty acid transport protein